MNARRLLLAAGLATATASTIALLALDPVLTAAYEGRGPAILVDVIEGRDVHPLSFYQDLATRRIRLPLLATAALGLLAAISAGTLGIRENSPSGFLDSGFGLAFIVIAIALSLTVIATHRPAPHEMTSTCLVPDVPSDLFIGMADEDLATLYGRSPRSDDRLPALVQFDRGDDAPDGEVAAPEDIRAELRFRGRSARTLPKKSFNVRLDPTSSASDRRHLNLNAMWTDPTHLRERMAFAMFCELDVPAPRTEYFNVWINDIYEGRFLHVDRVDHRFLTAIDEDVAGVLARDRSRQLVEGVNSLMGFPISDIPRDEQAAFLSEVYDLRQDHGSAALRQLLTWIERAESGDGFLAEASELLDLDSLVGYLSVLFLIGDIDSFADDFWLYRPSGQGSRWSMIPWDKDLAFGSHTRPRGGVANDFFHYRYPVASGWGNRLVELLLEDDTFSLQLEERLTQLMDGPFSIDRMSTFVDAQAAVLREDETRLDELVQSAFVLHPREHFSREELADLQIEALVDFLQLRYAFLRAWIETGPSLGDENGSGSVALRFAPTSDPTVEGPVLATSPAGRTLAVVEGFIGEADLIELRAVETPRSEDALTHSWEIMTSGGMWSASVSLFYENDEYFGENWYRAGNEPLGRQLELCLVAHLPDGSRTEVETDVNPISNRLTAQLEFPEGQVALSAEYCGGSPG